MADDSKTRPAPPPRGMIKIDGFWQIRRFGLLVQRELTCIYGHRIQPGVRPFEIAIPCSHRSDKVRGDAGFEKGTTGLCSAQLYVFVTRPRLVWAMDITYDESLIIDQQHLTSIEEIVAHFGCGFPVDMKLARG